jgi:hypothetical protein
LDADSFVLKDPSLLFDSQEYNATGAIFWQDYWANTLAPDVGAAAAVGVVCPRMHLLSCSAA